jgi:hypothetical protein
MGADIWLEQLIAFRRGAWIAPKNPVSIPMETGFTYGSGQLGQRVGCTAIATLGIGMTLALALIPSSLLPMRAKELWHNAGYASTATIR